MLWKVLHYTKKEEEGGKKGENTQIHTAMHHVILDFDWKSDKFIENKLKTDQTRIYFFSFFIWDSWIDFNLG